MFEPKLGPKTQPTYPYRRKIEDATGLPIPTREEQEHHFVTRCLQHAKLARKLPRPKDRVRYAKFRFMNSQEDAYHEGHEEELVKESQDHGWEAGISDLYVPQTSTTRGGDPVLTDKEAKAVAQRMGGQRAEQIQPTRGVRSATGLEAVVKKAIGLEHHVKMAKASEAQEDKVGKTMGEFKRGTLESGSGHKVTDRDQAIAIALHQAGLSRSRKH